MLFIEALETVKCLDEGVIESVADANIGSILGIGFPGWTGGVLQYINGYDGGLAGFVARARELAEHYGERFDAAGLAGREGRARRDLQRRGSCADSCVDSGASACRLLMPRGPGWITTSAGARSWTAPPACWRRGPTAKSRWRTLQRPRV